ncbi:MAG: M14 family metallopeptidase [bacterium]|jgi:murein tripeptide amidase MpaA
MKCSGAAFVSFLIAAFILPVQAQIAEHVFPALGAPAERKVEIAWNRYYDTQAISEILHRIHDAHPELTRLYSIGQSYEGRDIWCLEVTNEQVGDPKRKPGMYIDGNIHGNEVQGSEVVLYTAWYLTEAFKSQEKVRELLDQRVFYLIPTINPDGRDEWLYGAHNPHSSRSGKVPLDNDRDGLVDEDPPDDLNGDGHISMMRKRDPNGRYLPHPDYPEYLMVSAAPDERGEYIILGDEGIDNDGDGAINEDGPGGYDSNRNWAYDWQPNYVQYGAHDFPFSLPNTRAVAQFVLDHPNIAAAQSFHNFGGMILRPPGREGGVHQPQDDAIMSQIAAVGEKMVPYYRSMVVGKDLYTVWGGEIDWFYGAQGIFTFTNELWHLKNMFRDEQTDEKARVEFARYLLLNEGVVKWQEYDHPTYGKIEIGGFTRELYRVPPSFLLEEECHRNMAFTLYHADQMPLIAFGETQVEKLGDDLSKLWIEVRNNRIIPTRVQQDVIHNITQPDRMIVEGENAVVISAGIITDRYFGKVQPVQIRPDRIALSSIPGLGSQWVQLIISGTGPVNISIDSVKGGYITREISLP